MPIFNAKSFDVAYLLIQEGFILVQDTDSGWNLNYPSDISIKKAKQIISDCVNLHKAQQEIDFANKKYVYYLNRLKNIETIV